MNSFQRKNLTNGLKRLIKGVVEMFEDVNDLILNDKSTLLKLLDELAPKGFEETVQGITVDRYYPNKKLCIKLRGRVWGKSSEDPFNEVMIMKRAGIRLVSIYDYEWFNDHHSIESFVKSLLRSRDKRMIRSKEVVEISSEQMVEFLKENHLFTDTIKGCTYCYGIFEGDELVAVSGFNKVNSKNYNYEWKRFSIKYGWMAERGLAKMFLDKFAEDHHGVMVDYQQMDRFPNSTDEEMGFKMVRRNRGLVSVNTRSMKFTRHRFIAEGGMTREETMKKYGFDAEVQTSGTITWVKEI